MQTKSHAGRRCALAFAACASMAATTVSVSYDLTLSGSAWYTGTFTGTDSNADGLISIGELTSFVATAQAGDASLTLSDVYGFGDFVIATDTWLENGAGWTAQPGNYAFLTWNGGNNSLNTLNYAAASTTITSLTSSVPEPASLALMAVGALALVARRKRANA